MIRFVVLLLFVGFPAYGKTTLVRAGASIQAALKTAQPGDTIEVEPGVYKESLVVDKTKIRLVGKPAKGEWPILDGEGKMNDGLIATGSGFEMAYFHIRKYKGNGVTTQAADDVFLHHLRVEDTGIYGIYPTRGNRVRVEDTVTSGIADAGIYIGMCNGVDVRRNETFKNVAGIEIENSHGALVEGNAVYDNAAGILVFTLPGLPVKSGENVIVRRNMVYDNNHVNFGAEGAIVSSVPSGSGIIVMAADKVRVEHNILRGNKTAGLIFSDLEYIADSSAPDPALDPQFDDNQVLGNFFYENGKAPVGKIKLLLAVKHFSLSGADIIAYGKGRRNCRAGDLRAKIFGEKTFAECKVGETTAGVASMLQDPKANALPAGTKAQKPGEMLFNAVCAGCHGLGVRLIGPPLEEVQAKYKENAKGIAEFALAPKKVRPGYPEMPSQGHLGRDKLAEIAEYILQLKR